MQVLGQGGEGDKVDGEGWGSVPAADKRAATEREVAVSKGARDERETDGVARRGDKKGGDSSSIKDGTLFFTLDRHYYSPWKFLSTVYSSFSSLSSDPHLLREAISEQKKRERNEKTLLSSLSLSLWKQLLLSSIYNASDVTR